jgi:hypothetical protein
VLGGTGADTAGFLVVRSGCGAGLSSLEAGGSMTEIAGDLAVETATGDAFGGHTAACATLDAAWA